MITLIILGYLLHQAGAPGIIWVAYGLAWLVWTVKVVVKFLDGE